MSFLKSRLQCRRFLLNKWHSNLHWLHLWYFFFFIWSYLLCFVCSYTILAVLSDIWPFLHVDSRHVRRGCSDWGLLFWNALGGCWFGSAVGAVGAYSKLATWLQSSDKTKKLRPRQRAENTFIAQAEPFMKLWREVGVVSYRWRFLTSVSLHTSVRTEQDASMCRQQTTAGN